MDDPNRLSLKGPVLKVLVVDDNPDIRDCLGSFLARCGHQTRTAANGLEALRQIEQGAADVIISDVQMPGMGGVELLVYLKVMYPDTPVILMSGVESPQDVVAGIQAFLKKPIEFGRLAGILEDLGKQVERKPERGSKPDSYTKKIGTQ